MEVKLNNRFKIGEVQYKVSPSTNKKGYDMFKNRAGRWIKVYENLTFEEVVKYQTNDIGEHLNRLNFLSILSNKKKK